MLQQTRAAAAIPYYEDFLRRFPTAGALANAPESEVLAAWSGLGYYSRARNLRASAARMTDAGGFPNSFAEIRSLPGVGAYTAAAVASIAFGLPHAVLDGNVMRVISRLDNDGGDVGSAVTRRRLQARADELLECAQPGAFNQAMMELGATVCLPRAPLCLVCPVNALCAAREAGTQNQLPLKSPKPKPERLASQIVIVERRSQVLLRQRSPDARRLAGFWELPAREELPNLHGEVLLGTVVHTIVNQRHEIAVYRGEWPSRFLPGGIEWVKRESFKTLPVTTVTRKALDLYRNC